MEKNVRQPDIMKRGWKNTILSIVQWSRISLVDKMFFTRHLAVMLKSGFSLSLALQTLAKQTAKPRFRTIILDIQSQVESGISFHKAISGYENIFGKIFSHMLEVGEASGKLEIVLRMMSEQMDKEHALKSKVQNAMMYPALVSVAMAAVGVAMFIFVVPQITSIYKDADMDLPLATTILIQINEFVVHNGILVAIGTVMLIALIIMFFRSPKGKYLLDSALLKIPIFSPIIKKINLAKFSRLLHSLIKTDIPIDRSFQLTANTMGNSVYCRFLAAVSPRLRSGHSITSILEEKPNLFPPIVTQMISVGESSGMVDDMMGEIAVFYEEEVMNVMASLASIIEPLLILVLGGVTGGIAIAIIMPIYSLVNQ